MVHLTNTSRSATFLLGTAMLMLFLFCAPMHAQTPTFKSTSSYRIANPNCSAQQLDPTTIGHQAYHSTIYTPFGSSTPSSNNNPGGNNDSGSGTDDDDVGIPGWADTPSEPLPIGDGMGILLLMATMMVGAIFLKQRKQLSESISKSTTSTTNINNLRGNQLPTALKKENTTTHMTTRKQTYQSFFQKLFLLLVFVCVAGEASADRTIYFRPSTNNITDGGGYDASSWYHCNTGDNGVYLFEFHMENWKNEGNYNYADNTRNYIIEYLLHSKLKTNITANVNNRFIKLTQKDEYTRIAAYRWKNTGTSLSTYIGNGTTSPVRFPSRIMYSIPQGSKEDWPLSAPIEIPDGVAYNGAPATLNLLVAREGKITSSDYYWAHLTPANSPVQIYFANVHDWNNPTLLTGKDIYTRSTNLVQITNTELWYKDFSSEERAFAYKFYGFIGHNGEWHIGDLGINLVDDQEITSKTATDNRISNYITKAPNYTGLLQDTPLGTDATSGISVFTPGKDNNSAVNKKTLTRWEFLNHTQTIIIEKGGKLNYGTYWLTGASKCSDLKYGSDKTQEVSFNAAYTAKVTLRAIPDDGYTFLGFYDTESNHFLGRGTEEPYTSGSTTYPTTYEFTYYAPNSSQTITAKFAKTSETIVLQVRSIIADGNSLRTSNEGGSLTMKHSNDLVYNHTIAEEIKTYVLADAPITFEATANAGYKFIAWFNDKNGQFLDHPWKITNPKELDKRVAAAFANEGYVKEQNINITGFGSVKANYAICRKLNDDKTERLYTKDITSNKDFSFNAWANTQVSLTAEPLTDYKFVGWYDGSTLLSTDNKYTYEAENAKTITAKFKKINKLTVSVLNYNPEYDKFEEYGYEYNTITLKKGNEVLKESYSSFSHEFNDATTVTLTATPEEGEDGYDFVGWYINNEQLVAGTNDLYSLTAANPTELTLNLSGAVAVNAHFAPKKCRKVKVIPNTGGLYTMMFSKDQNFNEYQTAKSTLHDTTYTYFPYGTIYAKILPQPNIGYKATRYKLGGHEIKPIDYVVSYTVNETNAINMSHISVEFVREEDQIVYLNLRGANNQIPSDWATISNNEYAYYAYTLNRFTSNFKWYRMEPVHDYDYCYKCTIPRNTYNEVNFVQIYADQNGNPIIELDNNTTLGLNYVRDELNAQKIRTGMTTIPATRNNCYRLSWSWNSTTGKNEHAWTEPPTQVGDFRLVYIEQTVVDKNTIREDYHFEDAGLIKQAADSEDIISLHIYNKVSDGVNGVNNPEIILQKCTAIVDSKSQWEDVERYMVFGPLRSDKPGVIKMPNRKNTASETIVVDKGIAPIIAATNDEDQACGVWNFVIVQDNAGGAKIAVDRTSRYEDNIYYIRTTNATGQYNNYTHPDNIMSTSEYAKNNSDYSHYFICDVDIYEDGTPTAQAGRHPLVKFAIANKHSVYLNNELMINNDRFTAGICKDEYEDDIFVRNISGAPNLPSDATVRFGWDIKTNRLTRAYIANTFHKNNEYLVVEGENVGEPTGEATYFNDNSNHLYSIDLENATAGARAKVKAKMNGQYQYFMGSGLQDGYETLISGNGANTYPIRLLYDFKDDRFTTIYRPDAALSETVNLETPVMIEREHNYAPTQIKFNSGAKIQTSGTFEQPAYAVMTFLESVLADASITHHEKMFYWISFPFNVRIKDVFGLGDYGKYWIMEEYDGAQRAAQGLAQSNWKYITKKSTVLSKNVGYVLCLNYSQILQDQLFKSYGGSDEKLNNGKLSLYFPSNGIVDPKSIVGGQNATIDLAEYYNANTAWNHHNWHIIGVPSFANPGTIDEQQDAPFVYQYWHPGDAYAAVSIYDVEFQSMHAYMVQYAGKIKWTNKIVNTGGGSVQPMGLAAKTDEEADKKIMLRLELQQAGSTLDKTYVQLRDDKGTKGFDMSLDLTKIINAGANIYSIVDNHEMAGNAIPKEETVLPLGVVITAAGEYTFAMPNGTEGIMVELIDYEQGTCTNLLVGDYTVNMPVGTNNTRFALRLKPDKVATSVEDITSGTNDNNVRKLLIDGVLYLQQGTNTYDAQGKHVQ